MPDLVPGVPSALSPLVRRIVAPNPGPFTGPGTNTYLVGIDEVAVIDPGPDDKRHIDAIIGASMRERVRWVLLTHTHPDHAPGTGGWSRRTGAEVLAYGKRLDKDATSSPTAPSATATPSRAPSSGSRCCTRPATPPHPLAREELQDPGAHLLALMGRVVGDEAGVDGGGEPGIAVGAGPAGGVLPGLGEPRHEQVALRVPRGTAAAPTPRRGPGASPPPGGSCARAGPSGSSSCRAQAATNVVSTPSTSRLAAMNAVQSTSSASSSARRRPPSSLGALDAELP